MNRPQDTSLLLGVGFILALLIISNAEGAGRKPIKPSEKDKCPVCGMFAAKYPDFLAEIVFNPDFAY